MRLSVELETEMERRLDLVRRLEWRYGSALERVKSPAWAEDLTAWHRLCRLPERRR